MWEWVDWTQKDIAVESERFQHGAPPSWRRRQVTLLSLIRLRESPRVKARNKALAFDGGHDNDVRPMNIEGGHILGVKLGGKDVLENVVPMYSHVNRGTYIAVEQQIAGTYMRGFGMGVRISLAYPAPPGDGRIPSTITVQHYTNMVLDPDTLGTFTGTASGAPVVIANAPQLAARMALDPHVQAHLDTARRAVAAGWTLESAHPGLAGWVAQGKLPPVGNRPYAHLDFLAETDPNNALLPMPNTTVSGGRAFSAEQREMIQLANRYSQAGPKAGECWSDVAADPHQVALLQIGTDTGIEIDHIMPMGRGGANAFSNAQVTSAAFNRSKTDRA